MQEESRRTANRTRNGDIGHKRKIDEDDADDHEDTTRAKGNKTETVGHKRDREEDAEVQEPASKTLVTTDDQEGDMQLQQVEHMFQDEQAYWDNLSGKPLSAELVSKARQEEMG